MVDDVGTIDSTYHINADLCSNSSGIWNDEKRKALSKTFIANIKPLKTTQYLKGFLTMLGASEGVA